MIGRKGSDKFLLEMARKVEKSLNITIDYKSLVAT